ncbi:MAG: SpoIIE family protein phosphatase [Clostridiaceae bacterium]
MKIGRKILLSLLGLALLVILLLGAVSISGFHDIQTTFQTENKTAIDDLYVKNVAEITQSSSKLAVSLAGYYAQTMNIDFTRIMGELSSMKGDIETIYQTGGTRNPAPINRYEEYIISQAAALNSAEVEETLQLLSAATPMFDHILAIEPNISLAYIVLENGMVISSSDTFYEAVEKADMRTRDWYKDAVSASTAHWSELYTGTDSRSYITCATPIYAADGPLVGVLAFDLRVSEISEKVLSVRNSAYQDAFILNGDGMVLLSSIGLEQTSLQPYFDSFIRSIDLSSSTSGYYANDSAIIGYDRIESTGWLMVTVLDYDLMMAPVHSVAESVSVTGTNMQEAITAETQKVLVIFLIVTLTLFALVVLTATHLSKSITKPIAILSDGAKKIGQGNLDYAFDNLGTDEMGMLASTFNGMTVRLKEYMGEVARSAAEKQRLESELDLARSIQLGMLPKDIDCPGYEFAGMMLPAKEVGGDFYDFFRVGDHKLCFVVADVSGKGVGAALFMTVAKMVIKTAAQTTDARVDQLLGTANDLLCQENPAELFVTAYVGIVDLETGEIAYACAGHNPPVIVRRNGTAEFIPVTPKLPLAGMEHIRYPGCSMYLNEGDTFVLYTDGVTEATNREDELYGNARLLRAASDQRDRTVREMVYGLKADVDAFVDGAPQFDDITLLIIRRIVGGESRAE